MAKDTNPLVTYFLQPGSISLAVSLTKLSATQHTRFFWRWERFIPREYWRTGAPTDIQVGAVTANDLAYANFSNCAGAVRAAVFTRHLPGCDLFFDFNIRHLAWQ